MLGAQLRRKQGKDRRSGRAGRRIARRPTRGLEIKDDTYAIIKLVRNDGEELPVFDSSLPDGTSTSGYANFLLQSVQEMRMEKHQIVETFGESYIFFFGEAPRFINVQAVLINSHDFNWEAEWWENYDKVWRGTKSVEQGARTYLFYDDNIVEGYMLQAQATKVSDQPFLVNITFKMFLTNYTNVSFIGDSNFPVRASAQIPADISLTNGTAGQDLVEKFQGAARESKNQLLDQQRGDIARQLQEGGFAPGKKISELLRDASPSFAVSADVWTAIERLGVGDSKEFALRDKLLDLTQRTGKPIRGLIASNTDEYVGASINNQGTNFPLEEGENRPPSALLPTVLDAQEVEDLFRSSIEFLSCFGADLNDADSVTRIGLCPKFGRDSRGSFKPDPGVPFGFGVTDTEGLPTRQEFNRFKRDPLGSVFGRPGATSGGQDFEGDPFTRQLFGGPPRRSEFGEFGSKYTAGAADPLYGYPSDFTTRPGFGQAGFGDFGGIGFGSGNSRGDPGFKDPDRFTFTGVASAQAAFNRFLKPREEPTSLTVGAGAGLGAGTSGLSGGASVNIDGRPSPFAMVVLRGTLNTEGTARQSAEAISERQQQNTLGFSTDNPFGVNCPEPGSLGRSLSFP